ncbi:MAG: glycine zipper 2TM domain-containing protein [Pseudomonadota bacterium]|nr:glycine zipper 2TM domain-containing protein [Pseudomonadota bacterium]
MSRFTKLTMAAAAMAIVAGATPSFAQSRADDARFQQAQDRFSRELSIYQQEFSRYQQSRSSYRGGYDAPPPPSNGYYSSERDENGYDPSRYYRSGGDERVLGPNDRVYAGTDGRYYCKRSDGTTGLILGAGAGGVLGNVIDGGHSRVVGTLLGAAVGAVAGKAIDQSNSQVRCR